VADSSVVPAGLGNLATLLPGDESPGYFQMSLRDKDTPLRPLGSTELAEVKEGIFVFSIRQIPNPVNPGSDTHPEFLGASVKMPHGAENIMSHATNIASPLD